MDTNEFTTKYDAAFDIVNKMSYAVPFPGIAKKPALTPLQPQQYTEFTNKLKSAMARFKEITYSDFIKEDGTRIRGRNITPEDKFIMDANGKDYALNPDGTVQCKIFPNYRIETPDGDTIELSKNKTQIIPPSASTGATILASVFFDNAVELLKILFPDNASVFTADYVSRNLNAPFMLTLWDLIVEMNRLKDIPFVGSLLIDMGIIKP